MRYYVRLFTHSELNSTGCRGGVRRALDMNYKAELTFAATVSGMHFSA